MTERVVLCDGYIRTSLILPSRFFKAPCRVPLDDKVRRNAVNGNVRETLGSLLRSTALEVGRSRERKTCDDGPHSLNSRLLRLKSSTLNLASASKSRSDT